jgi:dUTP pyrophosphatase
VIVLKMFFSGVKPFRATGESAGLDLYCETGAILTPSGYRNKLHIVGTGTSLVIPTGHFGLLAIRSSLSANGVCLANGVGIIDSDYRGEVKLLLRNASDKVVHLSAGDRIAQIIVTRYTMVELERVDSVETHAVQTLDGATVRIGGFGSTGRS